MAIQIDFCAEIAWICSARDTRRRSGSPSMMPTRAGVSVAGSRCAPRAGRRRNRCEPRRSCPFVRRHMWSNAWPCRSPPGRRCVRPCLAIETDDFQNARRPFEADTHTAGDSDGAVGHEQLAMVARNGTEPTMKSRRIEDRDLHAGAPQFVQERARCSADADPVEQEPHVLHPASPRQRGRRRSVRRLRRSGRCSSRARCHSRALDEIDHRVESRRAVAQQPRDCHSTRRQQRCARGRERTRALVRRRVPARLSTDGKSAKLRGHSGSPLQDMCPRWNRYPGRRPRLSPSCLYYGHDQYRPDGTSRFGGGCC